MRFSAQISGFSADFHRKWLDIVKQHPNNAEIWADWELQNGKEIRVLAIQKVAKTGNIGKKKNSSGRQYRLCKIPQHAELSVTMHEMTQD